MRHIGPRLARLTVIAALAWMGGCPAKAQTEIEVIINDIEADPLEGEATYEVAVYATVADPQGQPITGLAEDSFSVSQDGEPVELRSVRAVERSATVVLALDTSGSMQGAMGAVHQASLNFIGRLAPQDRVGIIYFNDQVVLAQSPSDDLRAAESIIDLLEAAPNTGTCLYDAAYDAVAMATAAPVGQRTVVLLTDGVDELPGRPGPCSTHTVDDVIALATDDTNRIPIYTIGIGGRINASELARISEQTGGDSLIAPGAADVTALFQVVAAQLKNQYELVYRTATVSGEHAVTVIASANGASGVGTSRFVAPPVLNLTGLDNGAILDGVRTVRTTIGRSGEVEFVRFELDGQPLSQVDAPPFEVDLDSAGLDAGVHTLTAVTALVDGTELTANLSFEVRSVAEAPPEAASAEEDEGAPGELVLSAKPFLSDWALPIGIGAAALFLLGVSGIVLSAVLRRKPPPTRVAPIPSGPHVTQHGYTLPEDMSTDIRFGATLATLIVEESYSLVQGGRFDLHKAVTKLGRSATNDIVIPDAPVSRRHAEIRHAAGSFRVYDAGSTYGTFVNNNAVGADGSPLQNGDRLRLGTRTIFIFTVPPRRGIEDMPTAIEPGVTGEEDTESTERWIGGTDIH